ncbi:MAG: hypothetical protein QMD13_07995 [Candidatus Bathyarchaeia archaeon]|nr:hypothetical protein [Candidatus Bathyarchaeia archaeon]
MAETGFSLLRKNLQKTITRVRRNIGLGEEPILQRPFFRRELVYKRPRKEEVVKYDEVKTFKDDEGRTLKAYYNNGKLVFTEEVGEEELSEAKPHPFSRTRPQSSVVEDVLRYRREYGILSNIRRAVRSAAKASELEVEQKPNEREEALKEEIAELRKRLKQKDEEIRRLSGHHY